MKLIQEASADDKFNSLMMKIQDAVEALEKLVPTMDFPVSSQPRMLDVSGDDLKKLAVQLEKRRSTKLQK